MPTLSTTYGPNNIRTETSGVPSAVGGGDGWGSLQALAEEMMRFKLDQMKRAATLASRPAARASVLGGVGPQGQYQSGGGPTGEKTMLINDPDAQMKRLQLADMRASLQSKQQQPMMRVGNPLKPGEILPDVSRFNAYDFQNYGSPGFSSSGPQGAAAAGSQKYTFKVKGGD